MLGFFLAKKIRKGKIWEDTEWILSLVVSQLYPPGFLQMKKKYLCSGEESVPAQAVWENQKGVRPIKSTPRNIFGESCQLGIQLLQPIHAKLCIIFQRTKLN